MLRYGDLLMRCGYDVTFITFNSRSDHERLAGAEHHSLEAGNIRIRALRRTILARRLRQTLNALGGEDSFSIKVSTLTAMNAVVRRARIQNVLYRIANDHLQQLESVNSGIVLAWKKWRQRQKYRGMKLLCVSRGLEESMRELTGRWDDDLIRTIYNPFPIDHIRAQARHEFPDLPRDFLLHIGRFQPQKRHDLLLSAYARSGLSIPLLLMTKADPRLTAMISESGLSDRVRVIGFHGNPYPVMAAASALLLCSDNEGLPGVLIEALICGTPVVSTDCPSGPSEILTGELKRWLVPMGDPDALGDAICDVLERPPVITDDYIKAFSGDGFVANLEAFSALPSATG